MKPLDHIPCARLTLGVAFLWCVALLGPRLADAPPCAEGALFKGRAGLLLAGCLVLGWRRACDFKTPRPPGRPALLSWRDDAVLLVFGAALATDALICTESAQHATQAPVALGFFRVAARLSHHLAHPWAAAAVTALACGALALTVFMLGHLLPAFRQLPRPSWRAKLVWVLLPLVVLPRPELIQACVVLSIITALLYEGRAKAPKTDERVTEPADKPL